MSGPVSTGIGDRVSGAEHVHVTSHLDQLSLAILSWVGAMSTSQRALTLCGWGVKGRHGSCVGGR